jgi:hypothetical protein
MTYRRMRSQDCQPPGFPGSPRARHLGSRGQRAVVALLGLLSLPGCANRIALRQSFNDYGQVYADTQNHQMLLNLARLHDHEPAYFFQLTQISSSYTFTSTLSLGDTKEIGLNNSAATNFHTGVGSLGGTATQQPIFTLVPLAGDKFAQQLLQPIKPEVFFDLYEEGWPIDLLMRVLIEKIAVSPQLLQPKRQAGQGGAPDLTQLFENNPWQGVPDPQDPVDMNIARDPSNTGPSGHYDRFLRACALAREFQKNGLLYVSLNEEAKPAAASEQTDGSLASLLKDLSTLVAKEDMAGSPKGPASSDSPAGKAAGYSSQASGEDLEFKVILSGPSYDALKKQLLTEPEYWGSDDPLQSFDLLLQNGFTVTASSSVNSPVRLVMRSVLAAMYELANEQEGFKRFAAFFNEIAKDRSRTSFPPTDSNDSAYYLAPLPRLELHPALELIPADDAATGRPIAALDYGGNHYVIADPPASGGDPPSTWNRDVFRLLVQLSFLTTTDPTAVSTPSLIQLH